MCVSLFSCCTYLCSRSLCFFPFFFNDTATTEIYTLSLHDALPISAATAGSASPEKRMARAYCSAASRCAPSRARSEEHTSELQSHVNLVCRLLLEKKKKKKNLHNSAQTRTSTYNTTHMRARWKLIP